MARIRRSSTSVRPSYNEDLITPRFGDEGDEGDAHPSAFPCQTFLRAVGILDDFMTLVRRAGLTSLMQDESVMHLEGQGLQDHPPVLGPHTMRISSLHD